VPRVSVPVEPGIVETHDSILLAVSFAIKQQAGRAAVIASYLE
jgi:hypothetical protein